MQVKIFESPDMATGLKMIRRELGPDALILSTRTVRNGRLGILGKPVLEITAAVDNRVGSTDHQAARQQPSPDPLRTAASQAYLEQTRPAARPQTSVSSLFSAPAAPKNQVIDRAAHTAAPTGNGSAGVAHSDMSRELGELKNMVSALGGEISRLSNRQKKRPINSAPAEFPTLPDITAPSDSAPRRDPVVQYLLAHDISLEHATSIAGFARESLSFADLSRPEIFTGFLRETMSGLMAIKPPDFMATAAQQRIALVGPTGVGKTTTLAKIAAAYLAAHSSSIALITIDTYRIAAVEQLKVYGEIMRLPVEVVISPAQLDAALEKHADRDLILIDTAGRSPRDSVCIEELATFLTPDRGFEKHLVLSAVTREKELLDTIDQFGRLAIDRTIFTKLDECRTLGVLLNIQIRNPAPLSFLTNGQRVPEDLLHIDQEMVSRLILPAGEGIDQ